MDQKIINLVRYITYRSTSEGFLASIVRIVKFLYLADLFFARENSGKTLTGWQWKFHNYGPWAMDALDAVRIAHAQKVIDAVSFASQFTEEDQTLFKLRLDEYDARDLGRNIPDKVRWQLDRSIKEYGGDTYQLLHHVYHETEPMSSVRPGDILDFTKPMPTLQAPSKPIEMKKLSATKTKRGKELIARLKGLQATSSATHIEPRYDSVYVEGLAFLSGEEAEDRKIDVVASVKDLF